MRSFAEIGVYRGEFAEYLLRHCGSIERYYLVDPWLRLSDWNKPANTTDAQFAEIKAEAIARTDFAAERRIVLQGKTIEVSSRIPNSSVDIVYIDGDHTARGIMVDLVRLWPKVRNGGILAGDDFCKSIWQHELQFEPTMVFPLAVHFAEACGATIYGLPFDQFAIIRSVYAGYRFHDLTGKYGSRELRKALATPASPENQPEVANNTIC